jgi:predicted RNase H-like HicB family nuclease
MMEISVQGYRVEIFHANEGGFVVHVPGINGHTQADSYVKAVRRAESLVDFHLKSDDPALENRLT